MSGNNSFDLQPLIDLASNFVKGIQDESVQIMVQKELQNTLVDTYLFYNENRIYETKPEVVEYVELMSDFAAPEGVEINLFLALFSSLNKFFQNKFVKILNSGKVVYDEIDLNNVGVDNDVRMNNDSNQTGSTNSTDPANNHIYSIIPENNSNFYEEINYLSAVHPDFQSSLISEPNSFADVTLNETFCKGGGGHFSKTFDVISTINKGAFGKVDKVRHKYDKGL